MWGVRQTAEKKYFEGLKLNSGKEEKHKKYYDLESKKEVEDKNEKIYYTGTVNLAWYLNDKQSVFPGERGKFEFYIIPRQSKSSVSLNIKLEPYAYTNESKNEIEKLERDKNNNKATTINKLVDGHLLLFRNYENNTGYSNWIKNGASIEIKAPKNKDGKEIFEVDLPYKVTIYWIWPKYFRNYIYDQKDREGDLFVDISNKNTDYMNLISFINSNRDSLFFNENKGLTELPKIINNEMGEDLDICSTYYNQADEYLGQNMHFVSVNVGTQ